MIIRCTPFWCNKRFLEQLFRQVNLHSVAKFINAFFAKCKIMLLDSS